MRSIDEIYAEIEKVRTALPTLPDGTMTHAERADYYRSLRALINRQWQLWNELGSVIMATLSAGHPPYAVTAVFGMADSLSYRIDMYDQRIVQWEDAARTQGPA